MYLSSRIVTGLLALLVLLALPLSAQDTGAGTSGAGGAGGNYGGPGDTVPGNPGAAGGQPGIPPTGPVPPGGGYAQPPGAGGYAGGFPGALPPEALPGLTDPEGPESSTPGSPPRVEDPSSWQLWWHYNRWVHLDPEFGAGATKTGTGGFFLGRGEKEMVPDPLIPTPEQLAEVVVPALAAALRGDAGNEMRVHGLQAFAKLRGIDPVNPEDAYDRVASRFLTSAVTTVSEKALLSLGVRGEVALFGKLHSTLHDETEGRAWLGRSRVGPRMRTFAAYALGLLGERQESGTLPQRIHASLLRGLSSDREEIQAACAFSIGLVPLPFFDDAAAGGEDADFEGDDHHTRLDQIRQLLAFLEDGEQSAVVRSQVPAALARLCAGVPESMRERVILDLVARIGARVDEPREVQAAAVRALGQLVQSGGAAIDRVARNELARIAYRSHQDRLTRYLATISLARAAARPGVGERALEGLAPTRRLLLRNTSLQRGGSLGWTALALGMLEEGAAAAGEVPSPSSSVALRSLVKRQRSDEVVGAAAVALGVMRDPEAEELLIETMRESGNPRIRGYCALALGMIGAHRRIPDLRAALEASLSSPFPVEQAAIALALLGDQETGSKLCDILESSSNPMVQASVASAMGWIRDPRTLERLSARLATEGIGDTPRAWTAVAIGRICDRDDWPWVARLSVDIAYDVALPTLIDPEFGTGLLDLH
jgi:hypothetical protein